MKRTLIIVLSAIFCVMLFAGCTQTPAEPTEHVHTLVHNEAKAPTCVNNGILEHWYCPDCNARFSDEAATTEVAFADLEVEELGHTGGTATCTEKAVCDVCGAAYGDLAEHTYDEGVVTAPTCTEGGYTTYTCACGHTKKDNATEATGHSYDAGVVTAPTCTEGGYTTYTCTCGHTKKENATEATGHDYKTVVTAPTCTEAGYTTYTCSVCGDSYKGNETAATGHAPNADDGDCTSAITCATCGAVTTPAVTHDFGLNNAKCANCDVQNPNYVPELAIPENSKLLADFNTVVNPHIPDSWGHGPAGAYYNSYAEKDGRGGVFAMGANNECFIWYNAIGLNDMDLTGMDTITFRIKVKNSIRALQIKHDEIEEYDLLGRIPVRDEWTEVTVKIADLGYSDLSKATIQFRFATWNEGETEYVWIDQVYASPKRDVAEQAIPEGSVMLNDYSSPVEPYFPTSWGTPDKGYYNFYEQYEGKAGVFAMGATHGDSAMWYGNSVIEGVDLSAYESMTIRMKASDCLWSLYLTQNNQIDYVLYDKIPVFNEWFEITIKIADFGFPDVTNAYLQFQFRTGNNGNRECVWVDQIYLTPKAESPAPSVEELATPEGAVMIADFSNTVAPYNPDSWGSGPSAAYYNSYEEYAGRAGVFAMGSNCEAFMWYSLAELNEMDLSGYETITFRMMVKSSIRSLNFTQHNTNDYDLKSRIPVYDEWFDLTINIADLNFGDSITSAILQFQFATWNEGETEYVWIDQVYAQ